MIIKLTQPLAADSPADSFDVRQVKKALNKLGYYTPYEQTGITGLPDAAMFAALTSFQADHNLPATGTIRPDDDTVVALNEEAAQTPEGTYIWRTVGDDKVRSAHAELNGTVRKWSDAPDPGEDYNCRCWAEKVSYNSNQLCIDIWNTLKNLRKEIADLYDQLFIVEDLIKEDQQEIENLKLNIQELSISSLPNPITGKSKIGILGVFLDTLDAGAKISEIEKLREKINILENNIENLRAKIDHLKKQILEKEKHREWTSQELSLRCRNYLD